MKKVMAVLAAGLGLMWGPSVRAATPVTVFAAASLTESFTELGKRYESRFAGSMVTFVFAGSQRLSMQLNDGAPADVFASANQKEMTAVVTNGLIEAEGVRIFVRNELVVIVPADSPGHVDRLEDLARPGLKVVLGAEEVPVGKYARESLAKLEKSVGEGFKAKVMANVVSNEETVKQVLAKVRLGEADAGIVYRTDAVGMSDVKELPIPSEFNVVAQYPIAVLKAAPQREAARAFVELLLSAEGQAIFQKWGFLAVAP